MKTADLRDKAIFSKAGMSPAARDCHVPITLRLTMTWGSVISNDVRIGIRCGLVEG